MKRATYYSEAVEKMIGIDESGAESFSGRVGFLVGAACQVAEENRPALTVGEWCALADANNGTISPYEYGVEQVLSGMTLNLYDSAMECDEKWSIDCKETARKIMAMPLPERLAVFEIARRFWHSPDILNSSKGYREAFERLGAKIAD